MDVTEQFEQFRNTKGDQADNNKFLLQYTKTTTRMNKVKPLVIKYRAQVTKVLRTVNPQDLWKDLVAVTELPDRYSRTEYGLRAAQWVKLQVEELITSTNHKDDAEVYFIETGTGYRQPSVVLKIGNSIEPGVVIGAHIDTVPRKMNIRPGADDDGSGLVTVLEVARALLGSDMTYRKPIYLIWYAANVDGLVGSTRVVDQFTKSNIPIEAVMQLDMTGYSDNNQRKIWLINDGNVDPNLNNNLVELISEYIHVPIGFTKCGYACSDQYNWSKVGISTSMPFEADYEFRNPTVGTVNDRIEILSQIHMTNFAKLAIAYAIEFAQPVPSL